jgi:hypothetical protein
VHDPYSKIERRKGTVDSSARFLNHVGYTRTVANVEIFMDYIFEKMWHEKIVIYLRLSWRD